LWHLYEVQHFWCHIIGGRPASGPEDYTRPTRSPDGALTDGLRRVNDELLALLATADPGDPAWSWSDDHTVGFTLRRQTHEALVHHLDGRLACDLDPAPTPPRLGADGVDEVLGVMLSVDADIEGLERTDTVIELMATDTGDAWRHAFATIPTTVPAGADGGADNEQSARADTLVPHPEGTPTASVAGEAVDLHRWLWGRSEGATLTTDGDRSVVAALHALIGEVSG
ncbi:MAG: maleylpyruvate isomerase N-terminal domain-containing protein, partial [Actinomycetota bacterium]